MLIDVKGEWGWDVLVEVVCIGLVCVFYFFVVLNFFGLIVCCLCNYGIVIDESCIVVEKLFGYDLVFVKVLNVEFRECFDEYQIYCIDYYFGKEIVQNLMVLCFVNLLFELFWNVFYIEYVQIMVFESFFVEGCGEYYDQFGVMWDMV